MASKTPTILIVDDEPATAALLCEALEEAGYAAETAEDAGVALQRLDDDIDLVLLDVMLPGLNGLEVCRRVRAAERDQHLPIIMLTALGSDTQRHAGFAAGADDYMVKPFDLRELLDRVGVWLEAGRRAKAARPPQANLTPIALRQRIRDVSFKEELLQVEGLMHYLVEEATRRPGFLAAALMPYARAQGWDEEQLGRALGCPPATLARLLLRPRPLPMTWEADVSSIADACGADRDQLAQTLRAVEACERARGGQ
jgi:DNA-binding response OmpR family regulator